MSGVGLITTLLALMSAAWILMTLEVAFVVRPLPHACPTQPCAVHAATPPTPNRRCTRAGNVWRLVEHIRHSAAGPPPTARPPPRRASPHAPMPPCPRARAPEPEPEPEPRSRSRSRPRPPLSPSAPSANPSAPRCQARRIHAKFGLSKKDIVSFEDMIAVGDRMYDKHPCRRLSVGLPREG